MEEIIEKDGYYGPHSYKLDPQVLKRLKTLDPSKPVIDAAIAWIGIFAIVKAFLYLRNPWLYPLASFFIAGRAGVFLQLAHEAAHGLIAIGPFNNWFGNWITCYPIGLDLKGYAEPHVRHHACVNNICDPLSDSEKYRFVDIRNPDLWKSFVKDLLGITALSVRFRYSQPEANHFEKEVTEYFENNDDSYTTFKAPKTQKRFQTHLNYAKISLVQLIILGVLFNFNPFQYILLWLLPLMTTHMFLQRVRGIAEHGLGIQLGVKKLGEKNRGTYYTRSFGTPINHYSFKFLNYVERWLIGSINVYYHHEHHVFPKVPYYNLPKLHAVIGQEEKKNNPYIFARGYFDCMFFSWRYEKQLKKAAVAA